MLGSRPWLFTSKHPTPTRNTQHRKDQILGSQSLAVYICEVLGSSSLAVHLMKQGGGRSKGARIRQSIDQVCQRKGGSMPGPLGDSWERRRAKHQALRATQMLHLRSCKRYAGREKVEAQAEDDIRILCQGRGPWGCNIPQLAERKRNLSPHRASGRPNQCATQGDASQPALCLLRAWGAGACPAHLVPGA